MKQRKCPLGKGNMCYDYGDCENCTVGKMIAKYEKKIAKLQQEVNKENTGGGEIINGRQKTTKKTTIARESQISTLGTRSVLGIYGNRFR